MRCGLASVAWAVTWNAFHGTSTVSCSILWLTLMMLTSPSLHRQRSPRAVSTDSKQTSDALTLLGAGWRLLWHGSACYEHLQITTQASPCSACNHLTCMSDKTALSASISSKGPHHVRLHHCSLHATLTRQMLPCSDSLASHCGTRKLRRLACS